MWSQDIWGLDLTLPLSHWLSLAQLLPSQACFLIFKMKVLDEKIPKALISNHLLDVSIEILAYTSDISPCTFIQETDKSHSYIL